MAQILIIEDETLLAKSLCRSLVNRGHDCVSVPTAEEGLRLLERMPVDIALVDLQLPGMSGLEAIERIRRHDSDIAVIIATAYGTMAAAVEAMRAGASDFLRKPLDVEEVALSVERAAHNARLRQTVSYYHRREAEKTDEDKLICNSQEMRTVATTIEKVLSMNLPCSSDYPPVLILGETGTGKDLMARILHYRSKFSDQPFIEVNCSTLPKGLEEAELFGYEKGAFTGAHKAKRGIFEAASGGTIFLNEVGDLSPEAQAKLLTVIEQKSLRHVGGLRDISVDLRVISASNRDLRDRSRFREDLYHRLNHIVIEIPPLRRRQEDIVELADIFLRRSAIKYGTEKELSEEAREALVNYSWPGNVRELRQLMERVTFLSGDRLVKVEDLNLPSRRRSGISIDRDAQVSVELSDHGINLEMVEKKIIVEVLRSCGGNVSSAARKLGLGREALRYRMKKHGISKSIRLIG